MITLQLDIGNCYRHMILSKKELEGNALYMDYIRRKGEDPDALETTEDVGQVSFVVVVEAFSLSGAKTIVAVAYIDAIVGEHDGTSGYASRATVYHEVPLTLTHQVMRFGIDISEEPMVSTEMEPFVYMAEPYTKARIRTTDDTGERRLDGETMIALPDLPLRSISIRSALAEKQTCETYGTIPKELKSIAKMDEHRFTVTLNQESAEKYVSLGAMISPTPMTAGGDW